VECIELGVIVQVELPQDSRLRGGVVSGLVQLPWGLLLGDPALGVVSWYQGITLLSFQLVRRRYCVLLG